MIIYQLAALFKPPENGAPEFSYVTPARKFLLYFVPPRARRRTTFPTAAPLHETTFI